MAPRRKQCDQGEELCQSHRTAYPTPLEWILRGKAGIRRTAFLDALIFEKTSWKQGGKWGGGE